MKEVLKTSFVLTFGVLGIAMIISAIIYAWIFFGFFMYEIVFFKFIVFLSTVLDMEIDSFPRLNQFYYFVITLHCYAFMKYSKKQES